MPIDPIPTSADTSAPVAPGLPTDYVGGLGVTRPEPPKDASIAAQMLKPITDGDKPFVHIDANAMRDSTIVGSFAKMAPFLPAMGLWGEKMPDGSVVIYDPTKVDPKSIASGRLTPATNYKGEKDQATETPPQQPPPPEPSAPPQGGNPKAAAGQPGVNIARSKSLTPLPPSSGQGLLGTIQQKAF